MHGLHVALTDDTWYLDVKDVHIKALAQNFPLDYTSTLVRALVLYGPENGPFGVALSIAGIRSILGANGFSPSTDELNEAIAVVRNNLIEERVLGPQRNLYIRSEYQVPPWSEGVLITEVSLNPKLQIVRGPQGEPGPQGPPGPAGDASTFADLADLVVTYSDATPQDVAAVGDAGTANTAARGDHVHAHGVQAGGGLHAIATTLLAGFMSAAQVQTLEGLAAISPGTGTVVGATDRWSGAAWEENTQVRTFGANVEQGDDTNYPLHQLHAGPAAGLADAAYEYFSNAARTWSWGMDADDANRLYLARYIAGALQNVPFEARNDTGAMAMGTATQPIDINAAQVRAAVDDGADLGDPTHYWLNAYIRNLFLNGVPQGSVPVGTDPDSTLHWSGTAWVENTTLQAANNVMTLGSDAAAATNLVSRKADTGASNWSMYSAGFERFRQSLTTSENYQWVCYDATGTFVATPLQVATSTGQVNLGIAGGSFRTYIDLLPNATSLRDVGSAALTFAEGHFDNLFLGGTQLGELPQGTTQGAIPYWDTGAASWLEEPTITREGAHNFKVGAGTSSAIFAVDAVAAGFADVQWHVAGVRAWQMRKEAASHNLNLTRHDTTTGIASHTLLSLDHATRDIDIGVAATTGNQLLGDTWTMPAANAGLHLGNGTAFPRVQINKGDASGAAPMDLLNAGVRRWLWQFQSGESLGLNRYDATGVLQDVNWLIDTDGDWTVLAPLFAFSNANSIIIQGDGLGSTEVVHRKSDAGAFTRSFRVVNVNRWLEYFDSAEALNWRRYDAAGVFLNNALSLHADGDIVAGAIGRNVDVIARNLFIGSSSDSGQTQVIINSPDLNEAQLHFQDAGINRFSQHLSTTGTTMAFNARDSGGVLAHQTIYTLATGAWQFPDDVQLASASPILRMGDSTGSPAIVNRKADTGTFVSAYYNIDETPSDNDFRHLYDANETFGLQAYYSAAWNWVWSVAPATNTVTFGGNIVLGGVTMTAGLADGTQVGALNYWSGSAWVEETTIRREAANTLRVGVSSGVLRLGDNSDTVTYAAGAIRLVRGGSNVFFDGDEWSPNIAGIDLGRDATPWDNFFCNVADISNNIVIPTPTSVAIAIGGTSRPPAGGAGIRATLTDATDFIWYQILNNAGQNQWQWRRDASEDIVLTRFLAGVSQGNVIEFENADPGHIWIGDVDAGAETRVRSRLYVTDTAPSSPGAQFGVGPTTGAVAFAAGVVGTSQKIGGHSDTYAAAAATSGQTVSWDLSTQDGVRQMRTQLFLTDDVTEANRAFGLWHSWASGGSASFVVGYTTSEWQRFDPDGDAYFPSHRLAVNTAAFQSSLSLVEAFGAGGQFLWADTDADTTGKIAYVSTLHYTNAEEPFIGAVLRTLSGSNVLRLGGGTASGNAATMINHWVAANATTTGGTEVQRMEHNGTGADIRTVAGSRFGVGGGLGAFQETTTVAEFIGQSGHVLVSDTLANLTNKNATIATPEYTTANNPVAIVHHAATSVANAVHWGGNAVGLSTVTDHRWYAAAAVNTFDSTIRMFLDNDSFFWADGISDVAANDDNVVLRIGGFAGSPQFQFRKGDTGESWAYWYNIDATASANDYRIGQDAAEDYALQRHSGSVWEDIWSVAAGGTTVTFNGNIVLGGVTQTAGLADGTQVGAINYWSGSAWVEETELRRTGPGVFQVGSNSTGVPILRISKTDGGTGNIQFFSGGFVRLGIQMDATENVHISRYDGTGTFIDRLQTWGVTSGEVEMRQAWRFDTGGDLTSVAGARFNVGGGLGSFHDTLTVAEFVGVNGRVMVSDGLTNLVSKNMVLQVPHYTSATEEPVSVLWARAESGLNYTAYGSGALLTSENAMQEHRFFTAANSTTLGGSSTEVWRMEHPGDLTSVAGARLNVGVGIGTFIDTDTVIEGAGGGGALLLTSSLTTLTQKEARFRVAPYDNTGTPLLMMRGSATDESPPMYIGGDGTEPGFSSVSMYIGTALTMFLGSSGTIVRAGADDTTDFGSASIGWRIGFFNRYIDLEEQANLGSPAAGHGRFGIGTATPNVPAFTDDGGTMHTLAYSSTAAAVSIEPGSTTGASLSYQGGVWAHQANVLINSTASLDLYLSDANAAQYWGDGTGSPFLFARKSDAGTFYFYMGDNPATVNSADHKRIGLDASERFVVQHHDGVAWRLGLQMSGSILDIGFGSTGARWRYDSNSLVSSIAGARLGVGAGLSDTGPSGAVIWGIGQNGAMLVQDTAAHLTDKVLAYIARPYSSGTEGPHALLYSTSVSGSHPMVVGGGGSYSAVTRIDFQTADGTNSVGSTQWRISGTGELLPLQGNDIGEAANGLNYVFYEETATAPTTAAGASATWTQNSAPSTYMYTDDAGNDHPLSLMPEISFSASMVDMSHTDGGTVAGDGVYANCDLAEFAASGRAVLEFTTDQTESATFTGHLPASYSGNGLTVKIEWTGGTANTATVDFEVAFERTVDATTSVAADSWDETGAQSASIAGPNPAFLLDYDTFTFTDSQIDGLLPGEQFRVTLRRFGSTDSYTGTVYVTALRINETNTLVA